MPSSNLRYPKQGSNGHRGSAEFGWGRNLAPPLGNSSIWKTGDGYRIPVKRCLGQEREFADRLLHRLRTQSRQKSNKIPGLGHEVVDQGLVTQKFLGFDIGREAIEALSSSSGPGAEFLDEIGFDGGVTFVLVVIDKEFEPCFHPFPKLRKLGIFV